MAVSVNWECISWLSIIVGASCLGYMLGPLILRNSHLLKWEKALSTMRRSSLNNEPWDGDLDLNQMQLAVHGGL